MPEVIGIDHIYITVGDLARAETFYDRVMTVLGFRKNTFTINGDPHIQYFNRHFGFVLRPARNTFPHDPYSPGLHHLCLRARTREDVDKAAEKVRSLGGRIDRGPIEGDWAPGYYFFVFEDPDGIRLEINHIPGKGLLATDPPINPSPDLDWDQNAGPPRF